MTKNVGTADRIVRMLLAGAVGVLMLTGTIGGTLAIILGALAALFLFTGAAAFCPLYALLHISSRPIQAPVVEHV